MHSRTAQIVGLMVGVALGVTLSFMRPAEAARNGSGTYSLPNTGSVPNPVSTGNTITAAWANGTLSDISTEITNSLDRGGRGAMTAPLQLSSGTAAAPSLTFSADTDTGLYRSGANDVGISAGGTRRVSVSSTTCTIDVDTVVSAASANGNGLKATGNGTGWGVWGIGGNGSGGGTVGVGGYFAAGTSGSAGLIAIGSDPTNATTGSQAVYGIAATNKGGAGAQFTGGAVVDGGTAGNGVTSTAGASTGGVGGIGLVSTGGAGVTAGAGVKGVGGVGSTTNGVGGYFQAGAAATGGTRQTAILADNGDLVLDGTANVTSTTAMKNRLSPSNIPKAWGLIAVGASPSVNDGFNISSASCATNNVTVNFAQAFSNTNYMCLAMHTSSLLGCAANASTSSAVVIDCVTSTSGAAVNLCAASFALSLVCFGNQ